MRDKVGWRLQTNRYERPKHHQDVPEKERPPGPEKQRHRRKRQFEHPYGWQQSESQARRRDHRLFVNVGKHQLGHQPLPQPNEGDSRCAKQ